MKPLLALVALLLAGSLVAGPASAAEAKVKRPGVERPVPPAAQKIAPAEAPRATVPESSAAQPAASGWLAPLAGLAAGLGLGALVSQAGLGVLLAAALVGILAGVAAFAVLRLFSRPRRFDTPLAYAVQEPVLGPEPTAPAAPAPAARIAPAAPVAPAASIAPAPTPAPLERPSAAVATSAIPADFDSAAFIRQAKLNFIRLQEANDRGDLAALRQVTTDRMFDAILAELRPHRAVQRTDVVSLNASLLEVATEGETHRASVRFHGMIREDDGEAARFEEVWQLQKPVSGTGWVLAGIQQVS